MSSQSAMNYEDIRSFIEVMLMFSQIKRWMLVAVVCFVSLLSTGCLEADFDLAIDSRLPAGLVLPPGYSRADVLVSVDIYTNRQVKFIIRDKKKKMLTTTIGTAESGVLYLKSSGPGPGPKYPDYSLVAINGMTEILEQKRAESIIYITDDPEVRSELLARVQ